MASDFQEKIHSANIAVHRFEAKNYEILHPEVYGWEEQARINSALKTVDQLVGDNQRKALDFGAGTGNLTGKLLRMGYEVTAVDISSEMCAILARKYKKNLETKQLSIINFPIEDAFFKKDEFDVVACYSVLHHLPDYAGVLTKLASFVRKGGTMYIDHEASPFFWHKESSTLANLVKSLYFHSTPVLNAMYFSMAGVQIPNVDYVLSDYWHKKEHPLDHELLAQVFQEENFEHYRRTDYYLKGSWIPNPLFYAYRYFCRPEMSCWIAKK